MKGNGKKVLVGIRWHGKEERERALQRQTPNFRNKYSQKRNIGVSVPISTFMHLWVIYLFSRSVCLFCWRKYVDRPWEYINRSQTHESGNLGWGRAISRRGIHNWDFRCSEERMEEGKGYFVDQRKRQGTTLKRQNTEFLKQIFPERNIGVTVPISTFMRLWAIYIFPRSVCLLSWRKYVDRSWDYINCSQTHECWNWDWGRAIPRKGIHKWDFR